MLYQENYGRIKVAILLSHAFPAQLFRQAVKAKHNLMQSSVGTWKIAEATFRVCLVDLLTTRCHDKTGRSRLLTFSPPVVDNPQMLPNAHCTGVLWPLHLPVALHKLMGTYCSSTCRHSQNLQPTMQQEWYILFEKRNLEINTNGAAYVNLEHVATQADDTGCPPARDFLV